MASEDNVKSLCEITGLKEEQATNLLTAYNGNLEGAINAFFENPEGILNPEPAVVIDDDDSSSGPSRSGSGSASNAASFMNDDDDNVRAPIPRKTEILLPQLETNRARIGKRRAAIITEVPFRNFELEGRIQEQMLLQGPSAKKITRLEALFMPPFDILFSGGFDLAQHHGRSVDRWLLVNLQDDLNFSCQMLNRDLWSDAQLKEFMRRHLVFWQQSNKTNDGAKFKTFYKVRSEPYLAMIDPRTGEEVRSFSTTDLTPVRFLETLKAFLVDNKSPHGKEVNVSQELAAAAAGPSTSIGPKLGFGAGAGCAAATAGSSRQHQRPATATVTAGSRSNPWTVTVVDEDEDDFQEITDSESDDEESNAERPQVAPAKSTKPSPNATPVLRPARDGRALGECNDKPAAAAAASDGTQEDDVDGLAGSQRPTTTDVSSDSESSLAADQKTRIMLKMPGNVSERLFFRSSRTLQHAMAKLLQKYEKHFPNRAAADASTDVRFFCQAIKADLATLDPQRTLLELKIHPNAVIHVTTDD
ncbi:UBX domain-containing protein 7 isoform X2 [Anopheles cruzii]|uniref:UBX domain-containing protein 7 isoform X2 n=1 Tax=Anopheles cruzii TaxID=68878 RepID=UPI0022EC764D|nr:UBX domain-containing protein 7 isoform X2 [Anopheles cruzii]